MKVISFDDDEIKKQLKNSPKIIQDYVKSLIASNNRWKQINEEALKQIKNISKNVNLNKR